MAKFGKTQNKIIRYIANNSNRTEIEIRRAIGRKSPIYSELKKLEERGYLYSNLIKGKKAYNINREVLMIKEI